MNSHHGSREAGNSVIDGSAPQTTALPGVVPHPAAAVDRYLAAGAWDTRSLPAAFRQAAATHAGRTALITPDTRLTYRELDARSDAVATGLLRSGLRPGERVLLQLTNSATAVVAWYGLLKAGLIPVCTLALHRRLEIEQIGRKSAAVAHLVQADFPATIWSGWRSRWPACCPRCGNC
jgi:2,3-dihydroxybenzoate-AMP ligase